MCNIDNVGRVVGLYIFGQAVCILSLKYSKPFVKSRHLLLFLVKRHFLAE